MSKLAKQNTTALDTEARAKNWIEQSEARTKQQVSAACNNYDFAVLWENLESYLINEAKVKSAHSLKSYRLGLRMFLDYAKNVRQQSANLLRPPRHFASAYRSWLEQRVVRIDKDNNEAVKMSPASVGARLASARAFYRSLRWAGVTEATPFFDSRNPKDPTKPEAKRHPYTFNEVTRLLEATQTPAHKLVTPVSLWQDRALLVLMAFSGLRVFEAVSVQWRDVNFAEGEISVKGKGGKLETVPLSPTVRAVLEQAPVEKSGLLFNFGTQRARQRIKRLCQQAEVSYKGCHSFRHFAGTDLLARTGRLDVVQKLLRHSDIKTSSIYAKMDKSVLKDAVLAW